MDRIAQLEELLQHWREQRRHGRLLAPEELCRDHPELLEQVRQLVRDEVTLDSAVQQPTIDAPPTPASISEQAGQELQATVDYAGDKPRQPRRPIPRVPGYEVQAELGHGGMGVVYKAFQISLKREVALKMVLAGEHASAEHLAQLRSEAESVAHLQHPNIVQIHEIGDHEGLPYFSLEFVSGGTLSRRMRERPFNFPEAAQLVETLARAVQHAHQRGVVHRDLKPGNVLLAEDGTPKITDFGLAKRLEKESSLHTQSGAILGTPSYMAPEQAEGKTEEIGPLVDVYSLGAILYELITGRAPFHGDSMMDTLHQVIHEEPKPPSQVQPKVPRDLETICLKALAKDPARRYASALALAQDLERFQAGEPILARREGMAGKLWRKARRNSIATAAVFGLVLALVLAGVAFLGQSESRQLAAVNRQFDEALETTDWSPPQRERLDQLLTLIAGLSEPDAALGRQRRNDRFATHVRGRLGQPRLAAEEITRLDGDIAWLAEKSPELAKTLRDSLDERKSGWQALLDAAAPFTAIPAGFPREAVLMRGDQLVPAAAKSGPVILNLPCQGPSQIEAIFDPAWENATEIGLYLNWNQGQAKSVVGLLFVRQERALIAADGQTIREWDVLTGSERWSHAVGNDEIFALRASLDGKILAARCRGSIRLFDLTKHKELAAVPVKGTLPQATLDLSADGQTLAYVEGTNKARVTRLADRVAGDAHDFKGKVLGLMFGPGPQDLSARVEGKGLFVWNFSTNEERLVRQGVSALGHESKLWTIPSGDLITVIDALGGQTLAQAGGPKLVALSPGGQAVAFHWSDGRIRTQMLRAPAERANWHSTADELARLTCADSGRWVATADKHGVVQLLETGMGLPRWTQGAQNYGFRLRTVPFVGDKDRRPSFSEVRERGGKVLLEIHRNNVPQRRVWQSLPPPGPLELLAKREGGKLLFRLNQSKDLALFDPLPIRSGQSGSFGLHWPADVPLAHIRASSLGLAAQASSLEKADELYDKAQYQQARELYQAQVGPSSVGPASKDAFQQEARYKLALCHLALNRLDDAGAEFERLVLQEGPHWPLVACFQLWLLRFNQNRLADLDAIMINLNSRHKADNLAMVLPESLQMRLLRSLQHVTSDYYNPDPTVVKKQELHLALARLLSQTDLWARSNEKYGALYDLMGAYAMLGQEPKAVPLARELLDDVESGAYPWGDGLAFTLRRSLHVLRRADDVRPLVARIDKLLVPRPREALVGDLLQSRGKGEELVLPSLYLERARAHYQLRDFAQAERDLDNYFRQARPQSHTHYHFWAAAAAMRGFLREDRGDPAGAQEAWRQGTYSSFLEQLPPKARASKLPEREGILFHAMLMSLTEQLSEKEAAELRDRLLGQAGEMLVAAQSLGSETAVRPKIIQEMWRTRVGKAWSRKVAFLDLPVAHYYRAPLIMLGFEKVRQEGPSRPMTAEQEDVVWDCLERGGHAVLEGKLSKTQALQLFLAWKGTMNFLGWGGVAPTLEPDLRGPLAYTLALRMQRLNQRPDAVTLLRTALADAPPDSSLRRLAQEELERLTKKSP